MAALDTGRIARFQATSIAAGAIRFAVSDAATRLRQARIDAGFESVEAACRRFGWKSPGVRHHDNGTRPYFDIEHVLEYAKAYRVDPCFLLGLEDNRATQPVLSAGDLSAIVETLVRVLSPGRRFEPSLVQALGAALAHVLSEPDPVGSAGTVARTLARTHPQEVQ